MLVLPRLLLGSPPPTRGTRTFASSAVLPIGITPAYAGNTSKNLLANPDLQDHPRLRGEHKQKPFSKSGSAGSPPPTRGTRRLQNLLCSQCRITPAYAGNTTVEEVYQSHKRDHPRLRGEHYFTSFGIIHCLGSPPPTRGTPIPLPRTFRN